MKKRLITGIIMLAVLIPLVIIEELLPVFKILALGFSMIGAYEMVKLYEHNKKYSLGVKIVVAISTALAFVSGVTFLGDMIFVNPVYELVSFAAILTSITMQLSLLVFNKEFDASDIGKTMAIAMYVGFGVASLVVLRLFGVRIIIYVFLITILTDVFAYVFGMLFGKHKMIERISPKKTWEGAIGGTIVGTLAATLFAFMYGDLFQKNHVSTIFDGFFGTLNMPKPVLFIIIFLVSLFTSIAGQIGDLVASRLKRTYDVKDFSNIFPGHGGFLDRFDSSIVASMVFNALLMIVSIFVVLL